MEANPCSELQPCHVRSVCTYAEFDLTASLQLSDSVEAPLNDHVHPARCKAPSALGGKTLPAVLYVQCQGRGKCGLRPMVVVIKW